MSSPVGPLSLSGLIGLIVLIGLIGLQGLLNAACDAPVPSEEVNADEVDEFDTFKVDCDFEIALGVGVEAFEPLQESGNILRLERGNQGLQHVIISAKADIARGFHPLTLALRAEGETEPRATTTVSVPWGRGEGDEAIVLGLLFVIELPERVLEAPLTLAACVETSAGRGCGEVPVEVSW
jgi:hypothetical protein